MYDLTTKAGTLDVGQGQIAISEEAAEDDGLKLGDTLTLSFPTGEQSAEIAGIYGKSDVITRFLAPFSLGEQANVPRFDNAVAVNATSQDSVAQVDRELRTLVKDIPTVSVQTQEEFSEAQRASVDQLLFLIYALLGLAIVIAVLGIVNTLALSVIERTREVGLLRAVGLSRRQLRRMVRLESIAIALLGAVLGVVMGLAFGVALQHAVADEGVDVLSIPVTRLTVFVVLSALVGVLAAVFPARRAARLNVLRAITTE